MKVNDPSNAWKKLANYTPRWAVSYKQIDHLHRLQNLLLKDKTDGACELKILRTIIRSIQDTHAP